MLMALTATMNGARAQDYPARPVTLVMPFATGAPRDAMARSLGVALAATLKQQVIIENTAGASGTIGSHKVARSRPGGHTLLIMNIGAATAPALYRALPYNILYD